MQARLPAARFSAAKETFIGYLGGGFAPAVGDIEARHRGDAIGAFTQGKKGVFEAKTERADYAGGHNRDASFAICSV
jgi:hypothetical protein